MGEVPAEEKEWTERCPNASMNQGGWRKMEYAEDIKTSASQSVQESAECTLSINMNSVLKDRPGFLNDRRNTGMESSQAFPGLPPRLYEAAFRKAQLQSAALGATSSTPVGNIISDRERDRLRGPRMQFLDGNAAASPVGSSVASRSASPSTASSAGQQGTANNGVGIWCENCNTRLVKLKRQALRLMLPNILNGTLSSSRAHEISAILHDKLQVPDSSQKWTDNRCEVCATHLNQLKHEAVAMVQSLERAQSSGDTSSLSNIPALVGSCNLASLQRCLYMHHSHDKSLGHSRQRQGKSPYATPNSMSSPMSAMQLAAQAQQYLEGDSASSKSSSASLSAWSNQQSSALPPHYQASLSSAGSSKSSVMSDVSLNRSTLQQHGPALSSQSRSPPMSSNASTVSNTSAAASFFARAAQKLNLTSKKKKKQTFSADPPNPEPPIFPTNFSDIILKNPPGAPPCLLRSGRRENPGMGKVKVMLRVCPSPHQYEGGSFLSIDPKKKQVTIYDPTFLNNGYVTPAHRRAGIVAPKMFAFDAIFSQDASQTEICAGSMADIVQSVVNGADGCLFCYGHARLGKTYTMIGKDDSPQNLGIIPCAISWLFKIINDRKERSGARFSVRVSAVEVVGKSETLKDLLAEQAMGSANGVGTSPGIYLREDPICGMQLHNQSELRAPTPEKAAFYLDAALAARSQRMADGDCEEDAKNSHMLFTLHIYQYRVDKTGKGGVAGGRSRLHLIDLGSCEKLGKSNGSGSGLSFSALGNVILALVNGAKHVPYKDSKLTQLLRESLGNLSCRTTMIAHVSGAMPFHSETLATVQMASRIHRMRKKKSRYSSTSSSGGESSCDEGRVRRPHIRVLHPRNPPASVPEDAPVTNALTFSDPEYISSSEQSCDTVIYVGSDGAALSDRDLTDNEGPPAMVPIIPRSLTVSKPPSFNRPGGRTFSPEIRRRNSGSRGSDGESGKKGTLSKSAENSPEIRRKNLGPPGEFICAFGPETARKVDANSNGERKILCEFGPQTASPASRHEFGPALPRQSEPGSVTGPRTVLCEFGPETARKVEKVDDGNVLCEFGPETARTADSVSTRTSQNDSPQQTPERKINSPRHRNVEKKSSGIPTPIHTHLQKPKPRDSTSTSPERSQSPRKSNLKSKSSDKQSHIPTPKKSPKKKQAAPPPVRPKPIPPKRTVSQLSEPGYNFAKEERIEPQGEKAESSPVPDSNQATDSISSMKSAVAEQPESAWRRISADEEETISCELPADDVLEQEEEDEEDSLEERAEPVGMSTTNEETAIRGNDKVSDCYFVPISRTEAQEQEQAQERVDTFGHNVSDRPEEGCRSDFDILDNQRPPLNFQGDSTLSLEVNAPDVCDKRIEDEYDINDEEIELCMMKQAQTIQEMSMKDLLSFSLETGNSMEVIGPGNDAEDQLQSPSETPMVDLLTKTLDQMMAGINNSPGFSSSELPLNSDSDLADMIGDSFEHPNMPSASVSQVSYDDDDIESIEPSLIPDEPSSSMYLSVDMFKKQLWDRCIQETVDQIDDLELGDKSDSSDEDHPLRPLSMLSVDSDNTFTTVSTLGPNSRPTSFLSIYSCDKVKDTEPYQSMEAKLFCEQLVAHIVPETAKPEKAMTDTVPEKRGRDRGSIPVWRRRESFTEEELDNQVITEESQPQSDIQLQENLPTAQSPTDVNMCNSTNSGIPTLRSLISKGGKVQKAGVVVKDNCIPGSFKFLSPPTSPSKNPDSPPRKPLDSTISVHAKIMPQSMTSESFYSDDGSPKQSPKHQVSAPMPDLLMGSPKRDPSPSKLEPIQFTIEEKSNQQSAWRKETRLWHVEGKSDPDISNISEMKSQITDEFVAPLPVTSIGMGSAKYSPVMSDSEEPPSWLSRQPDGACDPPEAVKETKSSVYNGKSSHVLRRKDLNGRPDGYASDSCCRIMKSQQFSGKALSPANSVCNCCSNREDINGNIRQQQHHQGVNHRLPPRRFEKEVEVRKASQSAKASLTSKTSKPVTNSKPDRPNVPPKPKATVKPRPHVKHDNQTRVASLADVIRIKSPPRRHNLETASLRSASSASSKSTKLPTRSSSTTAVNLLSSSSNSGSSKSNSKNSKLPLPSGKLTKNSSTTTSKSSMHSLRSATTSKSTQTNKSSQASGKSMQNQSSKSSSKSSSSGKVSSGASKIPQSSSKMSGSLSSSSKAVSKSAPSLAKSSSAKSQQGSAKTNKSTVDLNSKPSQSLKHTDSDSGNDSGIAGAESTPTKNKSRFLSPYSTVTKPRMTSRCSSGHGSDNSSTISETIGFTGSKMASPCTGGTSSGYESMLRDSEATASTSSTHDSLSESSAGRVKGVKMLKKKLSQGSRSRRTGPPRPSDSPSASRKSSPGRWVDLRPKSPNDTVALKVYEVDNIENVQRIRSDDGEKSSGTSSEDDDDEEEEEDEYYEDEDEGNDDEIDGIQCEEESMAYFNSKLAAIERKQENIATLKNRQQQLKEQLSSTKARLMIHSSEWNFNLNVLENMDPDAPNFVEALEDETVQLEKRLNVCKSHVMMVTCFDASPN